MDLTQIRYFLALAKTLNFTRAAELCNVTQPALTKSIQRLEGELGGALLLRERNHTQLTPLGATMMPLLQQTFDAAEMARLSAARFREQGVARLRVGLGCGVEPAVLSPLIQQVTRGFPDLEVTILQGESRLINEWLLASDVDVAVTEASDRLTERANRWDIFADPVVVVLAEGHALAGDAEIAVERLRGQALVGRIGPGAGQEEDLETRCAVTEAVRHRGSSEAHVHMLVRAANGIALSTARRLLPGGLVRRAVTPNHAVGVCVAALAGRPLPRVADAFLRLARARDWEAEAH